MEGNIKEYFVVDASLVLAFLLKEKLQVQEIFKDFIDGRIELISSVFLKYEVGNGLRSAVRSKRISSQEANGLYERFFNFKIEEKTENYFKVLELALQKNLSFYDASYILLAKEANAKLLTFDKKMIF